MFSTDNLQAGDNVVVVISDTFSGIGKYIGTVIKKTPSGMVYVRCCGVISRYKRDGEEYGKRDPYSRRRKYLIESTEEEQKKIALQRKRSQMEAYLKDYKYADLSYEDLEKVCKMLEALKGKELIRALFFLILMSKFSFFFVTTDRLRSGGNKDESRYYEH